MTTTNKNWLSVGVPFTLAAIVATFAVASASTIGPTSVCTFNIDDPIPIGPEPTTATTRFTEPIGDTLTAMFPEEAHVEVVSIKRTKYDTPLTATLIVHTTQATSGQWNVIVRGDRGQCNGKVWVGQGSKAKKDAAAQERPSQAPTLNAGASASVSAAKRACAVFIDDSIPVGRSSVDVLAKFTEPVGNMPTASLPAASKVEVISVKHRDGDEPRSVRLTLNTATAVTGQWNLTLAGDLDTCTGMVYVGKRAK